MTKQHLLGLSIYYGNLKLFFSAIITHNYTSGILLASTLKSNRSWVLVVNGRVVFLMRSLLGAERPLESFYFFKLKCCWNSFRFTESCKDNTEHSPYTYQSVLVTPNAVILHHCFTLVNTKTNNCQVNDTLLLINNVLLNIITNIIKKFIDYHYKVQTLFLILPLLKVNGTPHPSQFQILCRVPCCI